VLNAHAVTTVIAVTTATKYTKGALVPAQFGCHALWLDYSCMQWDAMHLLCCNSCRTWRVEYLGQFAKCTITT